MTTSTQALNQLLAVASKHRDPQTLFVAAVAEHLGLDGPDAEPQAVTYLYRLVKRIRDDIESLPLEESAKSQARSYVTPFSGLESFAHIHLNIQNAKNNFLKPDNMVGLVNLHMAMSGHVEFIDLDKNTKALAAKFRDLC
ncbi:MAG: hypothetical protein AAGF86_16300, partial [Pseudomonadota bacterium]